MRTQGGVQHGAQGRSVLELLRVDVEHAGQAPVDVRLAHQELTTPFGRALLADAIAHVLPAQDLGRGDFTGEPARLVDDALRAFVGDRVVDVDARLDDLPGERIGPRGPEAPGRRVFRRGPDVD